MADSFGLSVTTNQQGNVMAKKIIVTGKTARRIEVSGTAQRRIEPEKFAAALGAEPIGEVHATNVDPVWLAAVGSELIKRLRSSGGRPALADATEICRVPLRPDDVKALEEMVAQLETSGGSKPSVGQLVSVIVRAHLQGLNAGADVEPKAASSVSDLRLQQMIEEQVGPLREQVRRLEDELHSVGRTGK
jgi:hypothetical protein